MLNVRATQASLILVLLAALCTAGPAAAQAKPDKVRVIVLAILATDRNNQIDGKLRWIAPAIQKIDPKLTGFRLAKFAAKSLEVESQAMFPLVDNEQVTVVVEHGADKDHRVGLRVTTTGVGEISYTTACGKCFPIITHYSTKDNDRLIVAVMVWPNRDRRHGEASGKGDNRDKK